MMFDEHVPDSLLDGKVGGVVGAQGCQRRGVVRQFDDWGRLGSGGGWGLLDDRQASKLPVGVEVEAESENTEIIYMDLKSYELGNTPVKR